MTVSVTTRSVKGTGNGSNFEFSFDFEVFAKSELLVQHVDTLTQTVTTVGEGTGGTDYSVSFTTPLTQGKSSGIITYPADKITAMPSTEYLVITRVPLLTQDDVFTGLGIQLPATIEDRMDYLTHQVIYMQEQLDRVGKVAREWFPSGVDFDLPAPRAGYGVRWNDTEDGYEEVQFVSGGATVYNTLIALTDTPSSMTGKELQKVRVNASANAIEFVEEEILHVRDEKTAGTAGGASVAATWNVRDLNTVGKNTITGASLASNQITLPAGTYEITARAPAHRVAEHKIKLRNTTDSTDDLIGGSSWNNTTDGYGWAPLTGILTISSTKVFELWHYTTTAVASNGLGVLTNASVVEVYSEVFIRKIGD